MNADKLPPEIKNAVGALLKPYGVDVSEIFADAPVQQQKYMTPKQASVYCGLTAKTIRDKALSGEVSSIRLGNSEKSRVLILKSALDNWLESFASRNNQQMAHCAGRSK